MKGREFYREFHERDHEHGEIADEVEEVEEEIDEDDCCSCRWASTCTGGCGGEGSEQGYTFEEREDEES